MNGPLSSVTTHDCTRADLTRQKINFEKSAVYFSHNTPPALQDFYGTILGVKNIGF
ncbi:hypothetical protein LINGRAHAP2_LOCUS14931, partial [Linum grandiflorum]